MTDTITNLIRIPGVRARVVVDAEYAWDDLGSLLADGFDGEQADLLQYLSRGLRSKGADGLMQLQYLADLILTHDEAEYDADSIRWLLRELLTRLESES